MQQRGFQKFFTFLLTCFLSLGILIFSPNPALAVNNPELLPDVVTPIVDLANFLPEPLETDLIDDIENFEQDTGWKLRILTQYDRSPGRAVIKFWGLDDKSILLVADSRGGNLLSFSIGDDVYEFLPRTFWIELQSRFGNLYYIRDNGENSAILNSLDTVKGCLLKGGCAVVPGLPKEQWILTLVSSIVGGLVAGFAGIPRKEGQSVAWQWVLIMSPLWGILFLSFGIGPVVTRTSDWLPLFRNVMGFALGAIIAYISPLLSQPTASNT